MPSRAPDRFVVTRRRFLAYAGPTVAAVGLLGWTRGRAFGGTELLETPSDDEGPFYREGAPERVDARWKASTTYPLALSGVVRAEDGKPLEGIVLDLWHADSAGAYDMRTKEFRHRAKLKTDAAGRWRFETNLPGQYGYGDGRKRPRHVHVKLSGEGVHELTTQMYFQVRPASTCPRNSPWRSHGKARTRRSGRAAPGARSSRARPRRERRASRRLRRASERRARPRRRGGRCRPSRRSTARGAVRPRSGRRRRPRRASTSRAPRPRR